VSGGTVDVASLPGIAGTVVVSSAPAVAGTVTVAALPASSGTVVVSALPNVTVGALPAVAGTVAVSSLPAVAGTVAVSSAPAVSGTVAVSSVGGTVTTTALTDAQLAARTVLVVRDDATVRRGSTDLTVKRAFVNIAASATDGAIVAAVAAHKISVLAVAAVAGATATNLTFNTKPAGAGTAISCLFANGANGGEVLPFNAAGWFESASGEGLSGTTGAGSTTGIVVQYIEV
jgi:hypothetical protein